MRLISLAPVLLTTIAAAQTTPAPPPRAFTAIRANASFDQALLATFKAYEIIIASNCSDITFGTRHPPLVLDPIQLDPDGNITSATWKESQDATACGQHRRYNVIVSIRNGKNTMLPELPGETNAGFLLQKDALKYAASAIPKASCSMAVLDTALVAGLPSRLPSGLLAPWDERWTVRSCTDVYIVTMHFIPDATGTTITTSPGETHKP